MRNKLYTYKEVCLKGDAISCAQRCGSVAALPYDAFVGDVQNAIADEDIDAGCFEARLDTVAELVWVGRVQKLIACVDERHYFVWMEVLELSNQL